MTTTATDDEIMRKAGIVIPMPPTAPEGDEDEEEADEPEPQAAGMDDETKARLAAGRARRKAERALARDPVVKAKEELAKAAAKTGAAKVPTVAQQQRSVAANLMPDASWYTVQKRQADGDLTYIKRYNQDAFLKYGDPREFICKFIVPTHGTGTYEVAETTKDGVAKPAVSYDIDPEGDEMGGNGASAAVLKLAESVASQKDDPFKAVMAKVLERTLEGDGDAPEMTMEKVMMYQMMGNMFQPKSDPAVAALAAEVARLRETASASAMSAMIPTAPASDPNAIGIRDLMAMQKETNERFEKMQAATDARIEKVLDKVIGIVSDVQRAGDPLETALANHAKIEALTGGKKDNGSEMTKLAESVRGIISDLRATTPAAPTPGAPAPQAPAAFVPPELATKLQAMREAKDPQARLEASYAALEWLANNSPEVQAEYKAWCNEAAEAHAARLAGDVAKAQAGYLAVRTRLARFHGELMQRSFIDKETHDACLAAWEPQAQLETICEQISQLVGQVVVQQVPAAQVAAAASAPVQGGAPLTGAK